MALCRRSAVGLDGLVENGPRLAILALAVQAPGQAQARAARQQSALSHDRPPNGTQDKGRAAPSRRSRPRQAVLTRLFAGARMVSEGVSFGDPARGLSFLCVSFRFTGYVSAPPTPRCNKTISHAPQTAILPTHPLFARTAALLRMSRLLRLATPLLPYPDFRVKRQELITG